MSSKEERMNRNKSIIEDYKNGKPILEIAREYNLSETMCYKILKGTQSRLVILKKRGRDLPLEMSRLLNSIKAV